jgi:hypothetical protein
MWRMMALLDRSPAKKKHQPWSQQPVFIGVVSDFTEHDRASQRCKPSTRENALKIARDALATNTLSPARAASLRGGCNWVLCHGHAGKAALQPLTVRQYSDDAANMKGWHLSEQLKECLIFIVSFFGEDLPDVVYPLSLSDTPSLPPVVILSDAMWNPVPGNPLGVGQMAFIVWVPGTQGDGQLFFSWSVASTEALAFSFGLREKKQFICFLEEMALAAPYFHPDLVSMLEGRDVLHFGDNTSANMAAVKGYSKAPDMARVVSSLRLQWLRLRIRTWIEFVKSEANWSDDPSRNEFVRLREMGASELDWLDPPFKGWR